MIFVLILLILTGCSSSSAAEPAPVIDNNAAETPFDNTVEEMPQENTAAESAQTAEQYTEEYELTFEDFDFYDDLIYSGIPEEAYYPALKYVEGEWKYDLIFRYDSSDGYYFEEIGFADLSLDYDREVMIVVLHPRMANDGFESWPESDEEIGYEPFEGGFDENGNLRLYGNNAVVDVENYYAWEGREYILGTLWVSEEDFATVVMFRGQN